MDYKIVVDSSSNLPPSSQTYATVPLKIVTDQREFVDDSSLQLSDMLDYLEKYKGRSGTACPSVGEWLEAFGDAQYVFAIAITSNLSGCYNAAVQAKTVYEEQHPDRKVCTLDSLSTGPEMVLIFEKLQELITSGLSFEEIEAVIRAYMTKTHLLFSLDSLTNLARNGRVSPLVAKAAGLLGIRVVGKASDVGTLQPLHKVRGAAKAINTIVKLMEEMGFKGGKVRVAHCQNEESANTLVQKIRALLPKCDIRIGQCTGLCSFYAERGGILVGFEA